MIPVTQLPARIPAAQSHDAPSSAVANNLEGVGNKPGESVSRSLKAGVAALIVGLRHVVTSIRNLVTTPRSDNESAWTDVPGGKASSERPYGAWTSSPEVERMMNESFISFQDGGGESAVAFRRDDGTVSVVATGNSLLDLVDGKLRQWKQMPRGSNAGGYEVRASQAQAGNTSEIDGIRSRAVQLISARPVQARPLAAKLPDADKLFVDEFVNELKGALAHRFIEAPESAITTGERTELPASKLPTPVQRAPVARTSAPAKMLVSHGEDLLKELRAFMARQSGQSQVTEAVEDRPPRSRPAPLVLPPRIAAPFQSAGVAKDSPPSNLGSPQFRNELSAAAARFAQRRQIED